MIHRTIKVKIVKETSSKVHLYFPTLNRQLPIPKEEFNQRIENGLYKVVNPIGA